MDYIVRQTHDCDCIALQHLDDVVRIHTDGIVFKGKKELIVDEHYRIVPEDKTTGKIEFKSLNEYVKLS